MHAYLRSSRLLRIALPAMLAVPVLLIGLNGTGSSVAAVAHQQVDLKVLLIGAPPTSANVPDPTTAAWEAALTSEGVGYTVVTESGTNGHGAVALPTLSSGSHGLFDAVVFADSPNFFAAGQLDPIHAYESAFGVRQLDGYMFPDPALGVTEATFGPQSGTLQLTAAGKTAFPELAGPVPLDSGTYGYPSTVTVGAPVTPLIVNSTGNVLASIYQHPATDSQAGVPELSINFDYNSALLQWLLLAPGLINWVTNNTHLGLYRNYFGQDIDDVAISDNEWSSEFQCTPGAESPSDFTCPIGVANNPNDTPADEQMSAADVDYVVAWEKATGITLNLAFNAIGACTSPTTGSPSAANCTGSSTSGGVTSTDTAAVDDGYPDDHLFINELLANKGSFNWITHTWSHQFLGCNVWQPQPFTAALASPTGSSGFPAGTYAYEITAATAYGESEPSTVRSVTVAANGSALLSWPEAPNGTGDAGNAGPSLSALEATFSGGSGFWGYNIYRKNPGSTTFGLVGQVAENRTGPQSTPYTFTDTNAETMGGSPTSTTDFPTATDPGIDCSGAAGSWDSTAAIEQEIGLDDAFAAANGLPNFSTSAVVTGEHSGLENPNMTAALAAEGITTFASDGSRQPQSYSLGGAVNAPRYPSNIYYNAANWPDEINEYGTLYALTGTNLNNPSFPTETGHCSNSGATTCLTTAPTETSILASESRIMLGHVLNNDPRVGYAHQTDLIGPAQVNGVDYGYTALTLIDSMLAQYKSWYAAPIVTTTDAFQANVLAEQATWNAALQAGTVTASTTDGTITVTNNGSAAVMAPVTAPVGSTIGGAPFGAPYGGQVSAWTNIPPLSSIAIVIPAPVFTSSATASAVVGSPFSFGVTTSGTLPMTVTSSGALPAGLSFVDNANGTATVAGTPTAVGSYPITLTASNTYGITVQVVTIGVTAVPVANAAVTTPPAAPAIGVASTGVTAPVNNATPPAPAAPKAPTCAPVVTTSKLVATKALVRLKVRYGNGRCARVFSITVKSPVRTIKGARVTTRLSTVVVGRKALTVSTAQLRTVSVTMSAAGRRLVAAATAKRPLHATLTETGAGAKTVTRSITIRPSS